MMGGSSRAPSHQRAGRSPGGGYRVTAGRTPIRRGAVLNVSSGIIVAAPCCGTAAVVRRFGELGVRIARLGCRPRRASRVACQSSSSASSSSAARARSRSAGIRAAHQGVSGSIGSDGELAGVGRDRGELDDGARRPPRRPDPRGGRVVVQAGPTRFETNPKNTGKKSTSTSAEPRSPSVQRSRRCRACHGAAAAARRRRARRRSATRAPR